MRRPPRDPAPNKRNPPRAGFSFSGGEYSAELNLTRFLIRPRPVARAVRSLLGLPALQTLGIFKRGNHA